MKKLSVMMLSSVLCVASVDFAMAGDDTYSGQAVRHGAAASGHASASAANAIAGSAQVTSAASAMPLAIGGSALVSGGAASINAANASMKAATAPAGKKSLEITDEAITIVPPNEALKNGNKSADKSEKKI